MTAFQVGVHAILIQPLMEWPVPEHPACSTPWLPLDAPLQTCSLTMALETHVHICIGSVSHSRDKIQNTRRQQVKEERKGLQVKGTWFITVGNSWWQGHEASGGPYSQEAERER